MLRILTVCTANICRSPLAEHLLNIHLSDVRVDIRSAGTRALVDRRMPPEAVGMAVAVGIDEATALRHRARMLTGETLHGRDLVLAMSRDHRREIVEQDPSQMGRVFTIREFARLAKGVTDYELMQCAADTEPSSTDAWRRALALVAGQRGVLPPPVSPEDDDVIDPYGRSTRTYELAARQLSPAVEAVARVVKLVLS